jgi:hypothetical protein
MVSQSCAQKQPCDFSGNEPSMKTCETCGQQFQKPSKLAYWQWEIQRFCCRACVKRPHKPDSELSPKTRYRSVKVNGRRRDLHRATVEKRLGRTLARTEIVHHDNHNKLDNDPANLVVVTPKEHAVHHNQRYPLTKACVICGAVFTPHPTKRQRKQTCSRDCLRALLSRLAKEKGWNPRSCPPKPKRRSESSGGERSVSGCHD